jgi:hypothetical protein
MGWSRILTKQPEPSCGECDWDEADGIVQFAGVDGQPTRIGNPDLNKFGPRIGAAWHHGQDRHPCRLRSVLRASVLLGIAGGHAGLLFDNRVYRIEQWQCHPAGSLNNPFPTGLIVPVGTHSALTSIGPASQ